MTFCPSGIISRSQPTKPELGMRRSRELIDFSSAGLGAQCPSRPHTCPPVRVNAGGPWWPEMNTRPDPVSGRALTTSSTSFLWWPLSCPSTRPLLSCREGPELVSCGLGPGCSQGASPAGKQERGWRARAAVRHAQPLLRPLHPLHFPGGALPLACPWSLLLLFILLGSTKPSCTSGACSSLRIIDVYT